MLIRDMNKKNVIFFIIGIFGAWAKMKPINIMKNFDLNEKKWIIINFLYFINIRKHEHLLSKKHRKTNKSSKRIL